MRLIYFIIISVLLISCNENSEQENSKNNLSNEKKFEKKIIHDSIIIENKISHFFSNTEKKDEFYICIKGKSLTKGKAIFTITNPNRIEIFKEEFPSAYLIGYGLPYGSNAKLKDQEDYIKKRVKEFFNEDEFSKPAIKSDAKFYDYYPDNEIWEYVKSDRSIIGFHFLIGEELDKRIAFLKKINKVVIFE